MSGFRDFLLKQNALALAIGVIIGVAMGNVVNSLVNDIIMPPIGLVLGRVDFTQMKWVLKSSGDPNGEVAIRYGLFVNAVIAFVVVALVAFLITKLLIRPAPPARTKTCPFCKESIPEDARRCRACTSQLDVSAPLA